MPKESQHVHSHEVLLSFRRFPPDFSALGSLGFDSVSVSRHGAVVRKNEGLDRAGRPHLFSEIEIRKGSARLTYSCPPGFHLPLRRMRCTLLLMRVLSLFPGASMGGQSLSALILPSLEEAEAVAGMPYERLAKKNADLEEAVFALSAKNRHLLASSEEAASACIALEKKASELQKKLDALSTVSDESLRELVVDWIFAHRGAFNAAAFSKAHHLLPARAEQGLEMLLLDGTLKPIGNGHYSALKENQERLFSQPQHQSGIGGLIRKLSGGLAKK